MTTTQQRVLLSGILAFLAIASSSLVIAERSHVVYPAAKGYPADVWRLLWILPFAFAGLSVRAFLFRDHKDSPWGTYLKYFVLIVAASFLVFAATHSALALDDWLYYPVVGIITIWFGLFPGSALNKLAKGAGE